MRLALYQPDIPQNAGTILRLAACMGVAVDVIGPAGFDFSDRNLRRAGLDYLDHVEIARHVSFAAYLASRRTGRPRNRGRTPKLPRAAWSCSPPRATSPIRRIDSRRTTRCCSAARAPALQRMSTPPPMRGVRIPLRPGLRSLNIAVAAAMVLGEALRQTGGLPRLKSGGFRPASGPALTKP